MSPAQKGMTVAVVNLCAVGLLIAITDPWPEQIVSDAGVLFGAIVLLGAVPSLVGGALLGWLAARLEVRRATVLVGIALAAIAGVGLMTERRWIVPAEVSTLVAMLVLERWTRHADEMPPPAHPRTCGAMLAVAMLAAIAVVVGNSYQKELECLDSVGPYPPSYTYPGFIAAFGIFVCGIPVAVLAGVGFGALAGRSARLSRDRQYAVTRDLQSATTSSD